MYAFNLCSISNVLFSFNNQVKLGLFHHTSNSRLHNELIKFTKKNVDNVCKYIVCTICQAGLPTAVSTAVSPFTHA